MFLLWKLILVLNCGVLSVISQFENQYLGHHITFDEYNNLELACDTKLCLRDAQRLRLAATQNKTIEPCEDFAEFSMGRFIELGALNERYEFLGFDSEVELLYWERQRKVLATRVKKNDIRPFKIAKNYYQNCVNSDLVRQKGSVEILEYLNSIGGAPLIDSSWDEESFNVNEFFEKDAHKAAFLFVNQYIDRCPHPLNASQEIACLYGSDPHPMYSDSLIDNLAYMFKQINIDEKLTRATAKEFNAFKQKQLDLSETKGSPDILTVSELNNKTNNTLNWLKIINSRLTIDTQIDNDSEILIYNPEIILKLLELMEATPKRTIADIFVFYYLHFNKDLFIVYSFDEYEGDARGAKKSKQRWEQCISHVRQFLGPVLQSLYAERYFDKDVQDSAKELTKEVAKDFTAQVSKFNISDEVKLDVVEKLNTIQFIIGYPEELLDLKKIEELYEDLELNGTEGVVETYVTIQSYAWKSPNGIVSNWKNKLIEFVFQDQITYYPDDNIFYVPPRWIMDPFFHPNRSRFFNTATLFQQSVFYLLQGINEYLLTKWDIEVADEQKTYKISLELAYNNYVNWEKSGGKDLQLPGFFLTNRQMFWVANAHKDYSNFILITKIV